MADEPQNPEPQEPEPKDPKPDPDALGDAGKKALDEERKARREAERRLKELEPLADKAKELEDSQKTELEKLQGSLSEREKEAETLRGELQESRVRSAVIAEAAKRGVRPDAAARLVDHSSLEFDDNGAPTPESVNSAMDSFVEDYPEFGGKKSDAPGRPKEKLRSGAVPDSEPEEDPGKLADSILGEGRV